MATKDTIFKYQDGYILVEDLEEWLALGLITEKDRVWLYHNERAISFAISTLIIINGREHPFQSVQRFFECNQSSSDSDSEYSDVTIQSTSVTPLKDRVKIRTKFTTIPLLCSYLKEDKKILLQSDIALLLDLFSKLDKKAFQLKNNYLPRFCAQAERPNICNVCNNQAPSTIHRYVKHVISEKHLKNLTGVSPQEFNFWVNILTLETKKQPNILAIVTQMNSPPIPLIDFKVESALVKENERSTKIEELRVIYEKLTKEERVEKMTLVRHLDKEKTISCTACSVTIKSFQEVMDHILLTDHVKYLVNFGFSEKALLWWKKRFETEQEQLKVQVPKVDEKPTESSIPTKTSNVTSQLNKPSPSPHTQRVPLLSPLASATRSSQKMFIDTLRSIDVKLKKLEEENSVIKGMIVDWKCEFCSTKQKPLEFSTEFDAIRHVISSQKHKEYMKFTAPIHDLNFWYNWIADLNRVKTVQTVNLTPKNSRTEQSHKFLKKPENMIIPASKYNNYLQGKYAFEFDYKENRSEVFSVKCFTTIQIFIPVLQKLTLQTFSLKKMQEKAPLLDQLVSGIAVVKGKEFNDKINELLTLIKSKSSEEKAKNTRVNWKCTFCVNLHSNQIRMGNMSSAIRHIFSFDHRQNMGCVASSSDLNFWKSFLTVAVTKEIPVITPQVQNTTSSPIAQNVKKNEDRIAMLDKLPNGAKTVTKEKFNEILDRSLKLFRQGGNETVNAKKKVTWKCSFCSTPTRIVSMSLLGNTFLHIASEKHREKMVYKASISDLDHWRKWVEEVTPRNWKPKTPEPTKSSNVSEVSKEKVATPKKDSTHQKSATPTPYNNPRFPLLDVPRSLNNRLSKEEYMKQYNSICEKLKSLNSGTATNQKVNCFCYYCPNSIEFKSIWEVVQHVFNGVHMKNINYIGTSADFLYYEELIKQITPPKVRAPVPFPTTMKPEVKRTPVSVVSPVQPSQPVPKAEIRPQPSITMSFPIRPVVKDCDFPLFTSTAPFNVNYVYGKTTF
ncbi:C2H2-type domain-containing protein [Caenorhabditis elegans]|uniref:C2H2-type domain-containing protein n=1 Tax=Caenorhabditis elegans TaxID=6239 RepID=Q93620_CAEEL|nr:C2H2-type domain-containing protein [Caenorhabditis elegans]CAB01971.2 C2H2-type domain-containing protein [Caenorhabditis elegans]|eukprot:NP_492150.2 Uncharacterized protein CELE_F27D4.6 [Caenorhabditis elegans]